MATYDEVMNNARLKRLGMDVVTDPLAYAGGASVVPPLYSQYNPAGAYAEAGRTVPNRASEQAMAMNQLTQPQGGIPSDLHNWNDPYGRPDDTPFYEQRMPYFGDASVVPRPTMPTEKQIIDSTVTAPEDERDAAFSTIHQAYVNGMDFDPGDEVGLGVPKEFVDIYMAVPDEAKRYAYENQSPDVLQQFEEKYGFPLDITIELRP